jgi:polyisoprenyl-phosphate glycosyltransferase
MTRKTLSLVAPFYNEEAGVHLFFERVHQALQSLTQNFNLEIICVNDGSRDATLAVLLQAQTQYPAIKILDLSRNFGKEAALTAGLDHARGDAVIPLDADLQHPPETIPLMVELWEKGFEVVLAKRRNRETDGALQRLAARSFYRFSRRISQVDIPDDVGDFRLMDRKVVEALNSLRENSRFMKGLFAWVGFKTTTVQYTVEPRKHGQSSFNFWKLWNLALEGITSFSTVPLRMWTYIGGIISIISFVYALYLLVRTLIHGVETPGYASMMIVILFLGGIQLIGIGVLGEYLGRVFAEVKQRPNYIIREIIS